MPIVYKITNKINGKFYIGHSVRTLEQRWKSHLSSVRQGSKFRFHSAIRKYGIDQWDKEILFENIDVNVCKKKEEEYIFELKAMINGYNAKPGGCGGWIVPTTKYKKWKAKLKTASSELKNPNCTGYTNDELVDIGKRICLKLGKILTHSNMIKQCHIEGIKFPKSFRPFRFGGFYKNYAKILEAELNMKFEPNKKTDEHKEKLRLANLGKRRK